MVRNKYQMDMCHGPLFGQIVIFCLHGVPDLAHDFVSTSPENFEKLLKELKARRCKVIAMRDLLKYDL